MSDPDDFEHAEIDATGATPSKYYQVAVPSFPLNGSVTVNGTTTTRGDSFVRLGSFPTEKVQPPGFAHSWALAQLVGNASKIGEENLNAEKDGGVGEYKGDFLVGFADDTRHRDGKDNRTNRQDETKKLLSKGGWWDHADGNRVTTTAGDKIEVIQGNYKMVVLGRQDPSKYDLNNVFVTDVSGGLFQEQNACPTPCIKTVEYTQGIDGWTLYQDNGKGKVVTRFEGEQIDYFVGTKKESYVGQDKDGEPKIVGQVNSFTFAGSVYSNTTAGSVVSTTEAMADVVSTTTAPTITNVTLGGLALSVNGVVNTLEIVGGFKESFQLGATFTLKAAADLVVGLARTSFYGQSTNLEGGKVVMNASTEQLSRIDTSVSNLSQNMAEHHLGISGINTRIGKIENELQEIKNIGN